MKDKETLKKLRTEFLKDTVNHYYSNNRGVKESNLGYSYEKGCAIGRHLKSKLAHRLDTIGEATGVNNNEVFELLPNDLKVLGQGFLTDVQELHDLSHMWTESGLSDSGKGKVRRICSDHDLDVVDII